MQITIENFGPIKHFVFDTEKNLTLIFGKNSVGKSYAISLVYLILKSALALKSNDALEEIKLLTTTFELKNNDVKTSKLFAYFFEKHFLKSLNDSVKNTFSELKNIKNQFSKKELKITIENFHVIVVLGLNEKSDEIVIKKLESYEGMLTFDNIYYIPASRSGLYQALNSFGEIFAELSKKRNTLLSTQFKIPALSEPLSDYFLNLSSIETKNENPDFSEYVNEIEQEILQGKVEFNHQTKKIYFIPNNTALKLSLLETSSMVSEIALIVLYLKYILAITQIKETQQVPMLFIEEPEAHSHPETQVKLMRIFARIVKDNKIKLVITSHSNYIFNTASNLVMDNKINQLGFKSILFKITEEGSVAQNMVTDDYGIDDDNFIDVAESIYEEKLEIINKLNS
jgi:predicted ATPase